jgi:hypothetical protein
MADLRPPFLLSRRLQIAVGGELLTLLAVGESRRYVMTLMTDAVRGHCR